MTDETNDVKDVHPSQAHGIDGDGKPSIETMPEDNQLAYETYKKALAQRHKFKSEAEQLKAELEAIKQRELEREGKKDEALKYWKERASEFEKKLTQSTAQYAYNQVNNQITDYLSKEGCVSPSLALKLVEKELNTVEVDDNYQVSQDDLKRIVDAVKTHPESQRVRLFGQPVVNDMVPGSVKEYNSQKPVESMTTEELLQALKS